MARLLPAVIKGLMLSGLLLVAVACGPSQPSPTPPPVVITRFTALLGGELFVQEGCIRVTFSDDPRGIVLLWPPDYPVTVQEAGIHVVNAQGQVFEFTFGEPLQIAGGTAGFTAQKVELGAWDITFLNEKGEKVLLLRSEADLPHGEQEWLRIFTERCPGPYWIVNLE